MTLSKQLERISLLVDTIFTEDRIRRGVLHDIICKTLNVPRSNYNVKKIKAVLKASGIREVIIHGKTYYANYPDTGKRFN